MCTDRIVSLTVIVIFAIRRAGQAQLMLDDFADFVEIVYVACVSSVFAFRRPECSLNATLAFLQNVPWPFYKRRPV